MTTPTNNMNAKTQTWKWRTIKFDYTEPTQTEREIENLTNLIKPLKTLLRFVEGFRAAGKDQITLSEVGALSGVIKENERRLSELKVKREEETQKSNKKKK